MSTGSAASLSIVLPLYDEEDNVVALVRELGGVLDGLGRTAEIVIVDDGSTDPTATVATDLIARHAHGRSSERLDRQRLHIRRHRLGRTDPAQRPGNAEAGSGHANRAAITHP